MKSATIIIFGILVIFGWGANVYKLVQCDFKSPYKAEAIRAAGVFVAPIGVVTGYINIKDGEE